MSKRKTVGERIAYGLDRFFDPKCVAEIIDRAIRRAQAEAWDDGWDARSDERWIIAKNPYRGRVKR